MDVYLRSHCCEFGFQKKRLQETLKKYFKEQSQIYLLKINLIACSSFYFYIFVFKFLIKSCLHIFSLFPVLYRGKWDLHIVSELITYKCMTVCFYSNLWKLICLVSRLIKEKCRRKNWFVYILYKWNFRWVLTTCKLIHFRWWFIMRTTSHMIKFCTFLLVSVVKIER